RARAARTQGRRRSGGRDARASGADRDRWRKRGPAARDLRDPAARAQSEVRMSVDRTKIKWNGWGWAAHKDTLAAREDVWAWLAEELGMPSLLATPARPLDNIVL